MTANQKIVALHCLETIEPVCTPGSKAHAAFILLVDLLGELHGAASHAGPRRPRKANRTSVETALLIPTKPNSAGI